MLGGTLEIKDLFVERVLIELQVLKDLFYLVHILLGLLHMPLDDTVSVLIRRECVLLSAFTPLLEIRVEERLSFS